MYRAVLAILTLTSAVCGDTLKLKNGGEIDCTVLRDDDKTVTFLYGSGMMSLGKEAVASIDRDEDAAIVSGGRVPTWRGVLVTLAKQAWSKGLKQIPATVIDVGVLKHVPYRSFRCGEYEINVYGDPQRPAGVEVGIYNRLLEDATAKERCRDFIVAILPQSADRSIIRKLKPDEDVVERDGWKFEVTPPTSEDAYGGWWISVYSEAELDKARASAEELKQITVASAERRAEKRIAEAEQRAKRNAKEDKEPGSAITARDEDEGGWAPSDYKSARPARTTGVTSASPSAPQTVYVRGYTRKDGTYVQAHSRSAPRRK